MTPARWLAAFVGGAGLISWAIWSIVLATTGTATIDVVQWVAWAAGGASLTVAILTKGTIEALAGFALVIAAAGLGVVSGFAGPSLLAIPLLVLAGLLFDVSGVWYVRTHQRDGARLPA